MIRKDLNWSVVLPRNTTSKIAEYNDSILNSKRALQFTMQFHPHFLFIFAFISIIKPFILHLN